jgi:hypothetical protein
VVVLLITWGLKLKPFDMKTLLNVSLIVVGVIIASFGEIKFVLAGFLCQVAATGFEATRLVLIERLLSAFKMDAMVSLYYYAPICTVMNLAASLLFEVPDMSMKDIYNVGIANLFANALVAFLLNVSLVLLVSTTPAPLAPPTNITSDRQNLVPGTDTLRGPQGHPPRSSLHPHLGYPRHRDPILWLLRRALRARVLQARRRPAQAADCRCEARVDRVRGEETGSAARRCYCVCCSAGADAAGRFGAEFCGANDWVVEGVAWGE